MQFGYHVGQVVLRETVELQQQWQDHVEQVRAAAAAGFDFVTWANRYLIHPFQHFQPLPVLSYFAGVLPDITLVTGILILPYLNPVQVAEEIATLDHICQGRLRFGVGLGHSPEECEAFGISMSERLPRMEEALVLMKRLWTEDEVTHHGRFFHVTGARPTARPYQKPYPPIWMAAMTDKAVQRTGRLGHVLFAGQLQSVDDLRRQLGLYHQSLEEHGNPIPGELVVQRETYVAETREEAMRRAKAGVLKKYEMYGHGFEGQNPELVAKISGEFEEMIRDTFILGSPEDCLEEIARYKELGVTHINLRLLWPGMSQRDILSMIELAGSKLLPQGKKL